jgi:hypothetical protein
MYEGGLSVQKKTVKKSFCGKVILTVFWEVQLDRAIIDIAKLIAIL